VNSLSNERPLITGSEIPATFRGERQTRCGDVANSGLTPVNSGERGDIGG
jgi:hypothetical protein